MGTTFWNCTSSVKILRVGNGALDEQKLEDQSCAASSDGLLSFRRARLTDYYPAASPDAVGVALALADFPPERVISHDGEGASGRDCVNGRSEKADFAGLKEI